MRSEAPRDGDPIAEALATAAAVVASAVLTSRGKGRRPAPGSVDGISIDRSLAAVVRETEWRMKEEFSQRAPEGAPAAFEGLDDVGVAVYLDHPALVSDAMDDGAVTPAETPRRARPEPEPVREAAGAATAGEGQERDDAADAEARARLAAKWAQLEEGSYFELLEVDPAATEQEIRAAHARLSAEFSSQGLSSPGLADLRARAEVLRSVLEEAYSVLRDPALRAAYAKAARRGDG